MKNRFLLLVGFISLLSSLFLASCAEEGPFIEGTLECDVEVTGITPYSANFLVTFPNEKNNLLSTGSWNGAVLLYDHPISDSQELDPWYGYVASGDINDDNLACVDKLSPNTTYYVVIERRIYFGGEDDYLYADYVPGCSFTTAKEGDYSGIGATYELMDYQREIDRKSYTVIKVRIPSPFYIYNSYHSTLEATSISGNEKAVSSVYFPDNDHLNFIYSVEDDEYLFLLPVLEKGIYKLQLNCELNIKRDISKNLYNVVIDFEEPLDLTNVSKR